MMAAATLLQYFTDNNNMLGLSKHDKVEYATRCSFYNVTA